MHHAGKGGAQRGTSRREDVLDTVISLKRPTDYTAEQGARFEIHFEKARGFMGPEAQPFEAMCQLRDGRTLWTTRTLADADLDRVVDACRGLEAELRDHAASVVVARDRAAERTAGRARRVHGDLRVAVREAAQREPLAPARRSRPPEPDVAIDGSRAEVRAGDLVLAVVGELAAVERGARGGQDQTRVGKRVGVDVLRRQALRIRSVTHVLRRVRSDPRRPLRVAHVALALVPVGGPQVLRLLPNWYHQWPRLKASLH